jgi:hypothetical protein
VILDDMISANHRFAELVLTAHAVEVPVQVCPIAIDGQNIGTDWSEAARIESLVPRGNAEDPLRVKFEWCRPAFPQLVFFRDGESGLLIVDELPPEKLVQGAEWGIVVWSIGMAHRKVFCLAGFALYAIRASDGQLYAGSDAAHVVRTGDETGETMSGTGLDFEEAVVSNMNTHLGVGHLGLIHKNDELYQTDRSNTALAVSACLALMNCKNITQEEVGPSRQQRRAAERNGQKPPFRYHVLTIRPVSGRGGGNGNGEPVALHWKRGHFKDFSEKGLFGSDKHKGVYWWSPHLAGRAKRIVGKDYRVVVG